MLLFGSHARGDQGSRSDTDLLLITQEDAPGHVMNGRLSTSFYSFEDLRVALNTGTFSFAILSGRPFQFTIPLAS